MSKYSPLKDHLLRSDLERVPMTFSEIEDLLGEKLPQSKRFPAWWSNNPSNNVMTKEWLKAGYQTERVNVAGEKLVFRRVRAADGCETSPLQGKWTKSGRQFSPTLRRNEDGDKTRRHPLFGLLKGTLRIEASLDLTAPADPDWGRQP